LLVKSTGVVRKVDDMGRIILPAELRERYHIRKGDSLEILFDDTSVILRKYEPFCAFCDGAVELVRFRGKNVCRQCISEAQLSR
jgi:transcriptional pleiotropic regulator of transition state genes